MPPEDFQRCPRPCLGACTSGLCFAWLVRSGHALGKFQERTEFQIQNSNSRLSVGAAQAADFHFPTSCLSACAAGQCSDVSRSPGAAAAHLPPCVDVLPELLTEVGEGELLTRRDGPARAQDVRGAVGRRDLRAGFRVSSFGRVLRTRVTSRGSRRILPSVWGRSQARGPSTLHRTSTRLRRRARLLVTPGALVLGSRTRSRGSQSRCHRKHAVVAF